MNTAKIIVALDGMNTKNAFKIAKVLKGKVWGFKLNDLLYEDLSIIKELKKYGKIFLDVKLYDIPNTVSNSVKRLSKLGADIITVHASGGIEMMRSAKRNAGKSKIITVTVLTSKELKSKVEVLKLANDALIAKMDGIVCSGMELTSVSKIRGSKQLIKVVPGIRPTWYKAKDDQKRKMTPKQAFELGADYLVIGRPITESKNILETLELLRRE